MMNSFYNSGGGWGMSPLWFFGLGGLGLILGLVLLLAVLALKGYALWHAARRSEKWWFIALLIVNTMGILELVYLFFIVGKWHKFQQPVVPSSTSGTTPPASAPKV